MVSSARAGRGVVPAAQTLTAPARKLPRTRICSLPRPPVGVARVGETICKAAAGVQEGEAEEEGEEEEGGGHSRSGAAASLFLLVSLFPIPDADTPKLEK